MPVAAIEAEGQPSAVAADAATFAFDQTNSKIGFIGKKITGSHRGVFPAAILTSPEKVALKAIFALDRKPFNINYAGKADDLILARM